MNKDCKDYPVEYPFADGRNMIWDLDGFGADEWIVSTTSLTRDQFLSVRHLFSLGSDEWMMTGVYPVPRGLWETLRKILGTVEFHRGVTYFLGGRQDLPDGKPWSSPGDGAPLPGPVPPPA
ncbi:hypothetical protein [Streptomyces sp. NPDC003077]|uniref:hypothetical protein n=1 Tax=Streptomyces sp. NPDC003077 TaxID=3154443 RepID=UPI0033B1BFD7